MIGSKSAEAPSAGLTSLNDSRQSVDPVSQHGLVAAAMSLPGICDEGDGRGMPADWVAQHLVLSSRRLSVHVLIVSFYFWGIKSTFSFHTLLIFAHQNKFMNFVRPKSMGQRKRCHFTGHLTFYSSLEKNSKS